jgi:hypothetical protein
MREEVNEQAGIGEDEDEVSNAAKKLRKSTSEDARPPHLLPQKQFVKKVIEAVRAEEDLWSIQEFAEKAGVPTTRVYKLVQTGVFAPYIRGRVGRGGSRHLFSPSQLEEFSRLCTRPPAVRMIGDFKLSSYSAHDAKRCFQLFAQGKTVAEVVVELVIHPRTAHHIHEEWLSTQGSVVLPGAAIQLLRDLELGPTWPPATSDDLVEALKLAGEIQACSCKRGKRRFCAACVRDKTTAARQAKQAQQAEELEERAVDEEP